LKPIDAGIDLKDIKLKVKIKNVIIFGMRFSPSKFYPSLSFSQSYPFNQSNG
jgi:hypothetical protein